MLKLSLHTRYWHAFQRSVLVGWIDDARDLLFSHSELRATEEQLSGFDKVIDATAAFHLCRCSGYNELTRPHRIS